MRLTSRLMIGTALAVMAAGGVQAHVATISGGYNEDTYDTPELIFNNATNYNFTNAQMVLTPYQPGTADYNVSPQTVSLGTIAANSNNKVIWGNAGPFFAYDWDDNWGNSAAPNALCVQPYPYCAVVGNFKVTFTATWANPAYNGGAGVEISSVFSPTQNATGGFVGWEGLNQTGLSETIYDAHQGAITGTLAYIDVGPPVNGVPEPGTWAMLIAGFGVVGVVSMRSRRKQAAAAA